MTPRVLFVGHSASLAGAELYLAGMLERSTAIEPVVLLLEEGPLVDRLSAGGIDVRVRSMPSLLTDVGSASTPAVWRTPHRMRELADFVTGLRADVGSVEPDLVYSNSAKAHVVLPAASRRVRRVVHVHNRIDRDTYGLANRLVLHASTRTADLVITNSEFTRASLRPRARHRAVTCYCPVDVASTPSEERHQGSAQSVAGVGMSAAVVGRISSWKGQTLALEALHRARCIEGPASSSEMHFYGDALFESDQAYATSCRRLAASLGLEQHVHWHGHVDDVATAMRRHDVVVHTSTRPEPLGQVVLEAMAAGVTVIAADAGGPREVISHGSTGWLYPRGSADELAAALVRVGGDAPLRRRLAVAARQRVDDFSYARQLPQWEAALLDLATR